MVPWKCDVEHAIEKPFVDVTDVADRDLVIMRFGSHNASP